MQSGATPPHSPYRLLFVSNLFPDVHSPIRGLDNAVLLHHLGEGWECRVISPRPTLFPPKFDSPSPRKVDGIFSPRYLPVPYLPRIGDRWNDLLMSRALRGVLEEVLEEFQPDIVLGSWLYPDGCALARIIPEKIPLVMITQGTDTHQYLNMPIRRRKILDATAVSRAVICRSGDLARRLREAGVPPERLEIVYNGVDTGIFHPATDRDRTAPPEALPLLLFVGNFLPVKAPLDLIRAHHRLNQRRRGSGQPPCRLVMIGDGPLRNRMEAEIDELGTSETVTLMGRMASPEIAEWMREADLLCLSSLNEGFPNVILEAMASGLPVVSTRVGGISEKIVDGRNGVLVPPEDTDAYVDGLERGLSLNSVLRENLAVENRENGGADWSVAASAYRKVLAEAMMKSPS